jgi:signal peptidase II
MKEKLHSFFVRAWAYIQWFLKSYLWIILILLALDIWSKLGVKVHQQDINSVSSRGLPIIPGFFYIRVIQNTGAAWSFFNDHPGGLAILSLVATIALVVYLVFRYRKMTVLQRITLYLIIAGTVGNLIDRSFSVLAPSSLYAGGVIDFLSLYFGTYAFPIFNLADSYLTIGVILLIIVTLLGDQRDSRRMKEEHPSEESEKDRTEEKKPEEGKSLEKKLEDSEKIVVTDEKQPSGNDSEKKGDGDGEVRQ